MVETTEKEFTKAIQELFKEWEKTKDKQTLAIINQLQKSKRSLQSSKMQDRLQQQVRGNIERRAELQRSAGAQFPNIANILTGGAPSPVSVFGNMQRQATRPFKRAYDYKQSGDSMKELGAKWIKGGRKDDEMRNELERMGAEHSGKEKRARSGASANLMGRRMQSMIGKVGKFMESSKGQGLMAGGMMGASILTMIIKKAMEASPMLQQMLKIMNVAMTLFLRPIGDFIGGMLKPIMLFFLREVAVPMLQKGKGMIKMGEQFGKNVMGFLLKPVETIQHAIQAAIHWDAGVREISAKFDGIKEWMTEQRMNVIAADMGYDTRHELQKAINEGLVEGNVDRAHKFGGGYESAPVGVLVEEFKKLREDLQTKEYNYATNYSYGGAGGGVGAGMGAVTGQFTLLSEETGRVITAFETLARTVAGPSDVVGDTVTTAAEDFSHTVENTFKYAGMTLDEIGAAAQAEWEAAGGDALKNWRNLGTGGWYQTPAEALAAAGQQIQEGLKADADSEEYRQARLDYEELTAGQTRSVMEGIQEKFAEAGKLVTATTGEFDGVYKAVQQDSISILNWTSETAANFKMSAEVSGDAVEKARNALAAIPNFGVGGSTSSSSGGGRLYTGGGYSKARNVAPWLRQHGGMINEPIWGIGKSGQSYMFGEAGPERVIPTGASTRGGVGDVTINVNVDSINSDVDLEKIKPVIERALQEVHSRRGII